MTSIKISVGFELKQHARPSPSIFDYVLISWSDYSYVLIPYNEIDDVITHSLFCVSSLKISTPKNMSIANLLERWEGGQDI